MAVIEVEAVGKRFSLTQRQGQGYLWELMPALLRHQKAHEFWALKDVSFSVERGETVAIVGPNGSGKSTLLKIVTGIFHPSLGQVRVAGKVCPLIELGAGFHHDLAGRDNIYLNGVILGMTKHQIDQAFDAIVGFAELQGFMDIPLKRLSSGMQMRLAFSVAVHAQPEILIVDEVLAVGDAAFQQKCFNWLLQFQRLGGTVLFVSHDLSLVYSLSDRVLHLEAGELREVERVTNKAVPPSRKESHP